MSSLQQAARPRGQQLHGAAMPLQLPQTRPRVAARKQARGLTPRRPAPRPSQNPFTRACVTARLGLCRSQSAPATCTALTMGPDFANSTQSDTFIAVARKACGSTLAAAVAAAAAGNTSSTTLNGGYTLLAASLASRADAMAAAADKHTPWVRPLVYGIVGVLALACVGGLLAACCAVCGWCHKRQHRQWQGKTLKRTYSDTAVYVPYDDDMPDAFFDPYSHGQITMVSAPGYKGGLGGYSDEYALSDPKLLAMLGGGGKGGSPGAESPNSSRLRAGRGAAGSRYDDGASGSASGGGGGEG